MDLSGNNFNLTGYWMHPIDQIPILLWATGDSQSAIVASGGGGSWDGTMYAPNGKVTLAGSDGLAVGGTLVADEIVVSGSDITILGNITGDAALPTIWLSE